MIAADRLIGKAQDYEVLAASHSEREALVGVRANSAAGGKLTVPGPGITERKKRWRRH